MLAEKLDAIVTPDLANTRIEDFFDILAIAQIFSLDGVIVNTTVRVTFERRSTALPASMPAAMSATFSIDPEKQRL